MPFFIKINVRHSNTGGTIRTVKLINEIDLNFIYNSFASTFSFQYYFDPSNKEHAETVCVSHMHEALIYWNENGTAPIDNDLQLTGYILANEFNDADKEELVPLSGYSKPGVLMDCDIPGSALETEFEGLKFIDIIKKVIAPFNLGIEVKGGGNKLNKTFEGKEPADSVDEEMEKTSRESSQNIGAFLSDIAKNLNIVLSHNNKGQVKIDTPNTRSAPILIFDFTDGINTNVYKKIPGVTAKHVFNSQPLHTHITVVQQSDDEEESDSVEETIRNPLLPVRAIYRPKTVIVNNNDDINIHQAALYELGREIREAMKLTVTIEKIHVNGKLIRENNIIRIRNPRCFLYNFSDWFIESVNIKRTPQKEFAILNCVPPFGYDFDESRLKNIYVDPHENLPAFT